jgi:iron complex outermembrane receptor protein
MCRPANADFCVSLIGNDGTMKTGLSLRVWTGFAGLLFAGVAFSAEPSELDYFDDLPAVLTVSRLSQPINETPGAVTIIDRETIRRSGARELADVLRLVPGYLAGGYNGANPVAAYHMPLDDYGIRNLVLIDGRPVYSAYYFGGTSRGMMGVLLEDIERIEVLRGSNSAAYGANAMFGVINIITRNSADTHGVSVSVAGGEGAIRDNYARIGWGNEQASFRFSAGRRSDSGYGNAYDDKAIGQLHFRGDFRLAADQELMFLAGIAELAAGEGFTQNAGNPERTAGWRNTYLQGQWKRQFGEANEIRVSASYDEETYSDSFTHAVDPSILVSSSGRGRRLNLELQQTLNLSPELRAVWGLGYKYEDAISRPLYASSDPVSIHEERLFGNLEWRFHPQWVINAGGFAGFHSDKGSYFSPRLMANFHVLPDHTLRAGLTESSRMPTLFELSSDVRLYPQNWAALAATSSPTNRIAALMAFSHLPFRLFYSDGSVTKEQLQSHEIGYFGNFRQLNLTLDARAYVEKVRDLIITNVHGSAPGYVFPNNPLVLLAAPALVGTSVPVITFDNMNGGFKTQGLEYQLRWKPLAETEFWVNQAFERTTWDDNADMPTPPSHSTTVAWFQKLPHDFDFSMIHQSIGAMTWNKSEDRLPGRRQLDMRLAKHFRIGGRRAEAAVVVQAANGTQPAYQTGTNFTFERRAFGTLRLEF